MTSSPTVKIDDCVSKPTGNSVSRRMSVPMIISVAPSQTKNFPRMVPGCNSSHSKAVSSMQMGSALDVVWNPLTLKGLSRGWVKVVTIDFGMIEISAPVSMIGVTMSSS